MNKTPLALDPAQITANPIPLSQTEVADNMIDNKHSVSDTATHRYDPPQISTQPKPVQRCRQIKELEGAFLQGTGSAERTHKPLEVEVRFLSELSQLIR